MFTFKPSTGQTQARITGLKRPYSVSYFLYNQRIYIVCEKGKSRINVYNQMWDLIRTIGTKGPSSAIVSFEDTIIISEESNCRISEFSFYGTFLRHLLVKSGSSDRPYSMSYYYPHLWVSYGYPHNRLYRYNLYR